MSQVTSEGHSRSQPENTRRIKAGSNLRHQLTIWSIRGKVTTSTLTTLIKLIRPLDSLLKFFYFFPFSRLAFCLVFSIISTKANNLATAVVPWTLNILVLKRIKLIRYRYFFTAWEAAQDKKNKASKEPAKLSSGKSRKDIEVKHTTYYHTNTHYQAVSEWHLSDAHIRILVFTFITYCTLKTLLSRCSLKHHQRHKKRLDLVKT